MDAWRSELLADIPNAPLGDTLIRRYRANYHIPPEVELTESMALYHWHLERQLTRRLWSSTRENRSEVFAQAYFELYDRLSWLNHADEKATGSSLDLVAADVLALLDIFPSSLANIGALSMASASKVKLVGSSSVSSTLN